MSILEKTKELAEAIANCQELKEVRAAEGRMKLDPDAQDIIKEFQEKQQEIYQVQMQGGQLSAEQQNTVKTIEGKMQANDSIKGFIEAQQKFEQLMQSVNTIITQAIAGDSADACGEDGCSTCNGCG